MVAPWWCLLLALLGMAAAAANRELRLEVSSSAVTAEDVGASHRSGFKRIASLRNPMSATLVSSAHRITLPVEGGEEKMVLERYVDIWVSGGSFKLALGNSEKRHRKTHQGLHVVFKTWTSVLCAGLPMYHTWATGGGGDGGGIPKG